MNVCIGCGEIPFFSHRLAMLCCSLLAGGSVPCLLKYRS